MSVQRQTQRSESTAVRVNLLLNRIYAYYYTSVYCLICDDIDRCVCQYTGEAMNTFLNDNWRHVAQEFKPILEETIGDLFKKFANKLYHKYPMDEILPI